MVQPSLDSIFGSRSIATVPLRTLVDWVEPNSRPRLVLPPIQRSLVWRNEQIVNYWDSLLRGYPTGTMLVHETKTSMEHPNSARDFSNRTVEASPGDLQLFDGQQRLSAILLGFDKGPLIQHLRLWVDIGAKQPSGDRLFELRISSEGQPFGYTADRPNEKFPVSDRRNQNSEWLDNASKQPLSPQIIFSKINHGLLPAPLLKANCVVPLSVFLRPQEERDRSLQQILLMKNVDSSTIDDLKKAVQHLFESVIILQKLSADLLDHQNYIRFFARVGQGGTRLTDDELIYSLIKKNYPEIHETLSKIVGDKETGRLASDVDLVMASLRVAKAMRPWKDAKNWEKFNRPIPALIYRLDGAEQLETKIFFQNIVLLGDPSPLYQALKAIRSALIYHETHNPKGLPSMLLARMDRDLLDVLLLFTIDKGGETRIWKGVDKEALLTFVLYWVLFVFNTNKASDKCFAAATEEDWFFQAKTLARLVQSFERDGLAHYAPRQELWPALEGQAQDRKSLLMSWAERFVTTRQAGNETDPGHSIRVLATHPEQIRRLLLWLQRHYITTAYDNYDPTSARDEDLPYDLDHLIPYALFGDWTTLEKRLAPDCAGELSEVFRARRRDFGNSLGNYRWLSASDNRVRQSSRIEDERSDKKSVQDDVDREQWNSLIEKKSWSAADLGVFHRLIEERTVRLIRRYVNESGVSDLLNDVDKLSMHE